MDGDGATLAYTAAATLVALLTTDAWTRAKAEVVAFWRRLRPSHADLIESDLTRAHDEASAGGEAAAGTLTAEWESRLRRVVASNDETASGGETASEAEAGAELRRMSDALSALLAETTGQRTLIQDAKVSDRGTVIQVGRDARIGDVMLGERPIQVQRAEATDAAVIIQVGRDLYVSDPALSALWVPGETTPGQCPFPGLDVFGPGQARWFFGRQRLTGDLLQMLDESGPGLVLVVGPSGAGKSSLLGAGLLAAISEGRFPAPGSPSWPRLMITPGAHPAQTLRDALARAHNDGATPVVLVVDQLEEIFTACDDEDERADFLGRLASVDGLVVAGLRADFYARATGYPALRTAMQSCQMVLGSMTPAEIRDAITLPARSAGLRLDDGLVERLLRDLGVDEMGGYEPGRLPLLAHALRATWQRRSGDRLTISGYEATGGIHGAVAKTAEDVYTRLDDRHQSAARRLFLALVRIGDGDGTADTRRRVNAESLYAQVPDPDATRTVLSAFTAARLLTSGGQAVEVTHEALLRRWPRLTEWLDEDRAGNLVLQGAEEAATAWDREDRDHATLFSGARLAAARAWIAADPGHERELSPLARDFLSASDRSRRRGVRRRNEIIAILGALVIALGGLSIFANSQRATAQSNFREAEATVFASQANAALADNRPDTAMEFALRAEQLDPSAPGVLSALLSTQTQPVTGRLQPRPGDSYAIYGTSYSPDGTLIAAGSYEYVTLWSAASRQVLATLTPVFDGSPATVHAVAFSADSKTLAATGGGGAWLWNVTDPRHPVAEAVLGSGGTTYAGTAVAFSPDGRTLAVAETTANGTPGPVLVFNLSSRTLERVITPDVPISALSFAGSGRYIVTTADVVGTGGPVQLWDLSQHGHVTALTVGTGTSATVAVSPDGQTIVFPPASSTAHALKLWRLPTHQASTLTTGSSQDVTTVAFSANGRYLAAAGLDGMVRLWDVRSGRVPALLSTLDASTTAIYHVAFSPDGSTLASTDGDTVTLWNVPANTLGGRVNSSQAVAFSPDGRLLAVGTVIGTTAGSAAAVELYAMPARKLIATLDAGTGADLVTALAFSPDGRKLAVAVYAPLNPVQMWNVASHRPAGVISTGQPEQVRSIAFSPDGRLLATASLGSPQVRLWSVTRLSPVATILASQDNLYAVTGQWAVAFSPDGRLLAIGGSDGFTRLYTLPGDKLAGIYLMGVGTLPWTLTFSPVGRTLAVAGSDGSVYLFRDVGPSTTTYHLSANALPDSRQTVTALDFIPNSQTLIAAGEDGTVRIWDTVTGALRASFQASPDIIPSVAYSASTGIIATASSVTRVWQTDPGEVADKICSTLRAPVDPRLWTQYVSQYPYTPVCG